MTVLAREQSDTSALEAQGVRILTGDLADLESLGGDFLKGFDVVYHVGARVVSTGAWEEFEKANVTATRQLLEMAETFGLKRFVYVSSLGIFDIPSAGVTITEESDYDHEPLLRGHYTRSKIHADRLACAAARAGKPVVVVRPGRIYGHDHPSQPLFMGRVKKRLMGNTWVVVSRPSYLVPVAYVDNAAEAVVMAGTRDGVEGQIFNVIDDDTLTQKEYFRALAEIEKSKGRGLRVAFLPVGLFVPAVIAVDTLFKFLKRRAWSVAYQLRRSGRNARYSTDAARSELGWQPRTSLREALELSLR